MNPNIQNFNTPNSQTRQSVQYSNDSYKTSSPRIETTHYKSNQMNISGNNQAYQTVAFDQNIKVQTSTLSGYKQAFRSIPVDQTVIIREDIGSDIDFVRNFSKLEFDYNLAGECNFHNCMEHKEEKANIAYKQVEGKFVFYKNLCDICLSNSDLEEQGYKVEHFSSILKKRKEEILEINSDNFETEIHLENMWQNLKSLILNSAVKAIEYSKSFQENYMSLLGKNKLSSKDVEMVKVLLSKLLDKNNNLSFRGIGEHPELKEQYISLAIYLINYQRKSLVTLNFVEMESYLKKYILEIFQIRQDTVNNYTAWLRQLVGYYQTICQVGNLRIDNAFLSTINIDLFSGVRIETRESTDYMQRYNDLLVKYNSEIKIMELTIYNLRNSVNINTTNIQVQEVKLFKFI